MGSFWNVPNCFEAPTSVSIPYMGGGKTITVAEYEQALADNDTVQVSEWDTLLNAFNIQYYEETPPECEIDPEED